MRICANGWVTGKPHHRFVPNRSSQIQEAEITGRRLQAELGRELRDARLARGLRQADVSRALRTSRFHVSRTERSVGDGAGVIDLARHAAAVGLRLHARFYPVGGGLRDAAQLDLLRRLRARIGDRWSWTLEAPLNIPGDLRAFDALISNPSATIAVEAITRLRDAQAQLRAAALKQRDGNVPRLVLLIKATQHNREALASAAGVLATSFPLGTRATLKALSEGTDPGDNGIVLL
jgi:transcriptional regulator with XRE-family HTH domain